MGFIVNVVKSVLDPYQVIAHLGAMTDAGILFPTSASLETIARSTGITQVSALCLHQVTGLMVSCHLLVPLCMLHLHPWSIILRDHFNMRVDQLTKLIPLLSPVVQSSLVVWSQ